jgi:hypothetical protein
METNNIFQFLTHCLMSGCIRPLGQSDFELYVYLTFCLFNFGEVFTYLPIVKRLSKRGCTGDGQSIWTWLAWICAYSTLAVHMYVLAGYRTNDLVWLSLANLSMCFVCLYLIIKVQRRAGILSWMPFKSVVSSTSLIN